MMLYALKVIVSAILIVLISEISKRNTTVGAIFASVPLVSFLAMIWIYIETKDVKKIGKLSVDIFWLVIPSLLFFLILPILLKKQMNFYLAFVLSAICMIGGYFLTTMLLKAK